jgi:hypothetical protein
MKPFVASVAQCIVAAAKESFVAGGEGALRQAVEELAAASERSASQVQKWIRDGLGKLKALANAAAGGTDRGFESAIDRLAGDATGAVGNVSGAALDASAKSFAGDLRSKCKVQPIAATGAVVARLKGLALAMGQCIVRAAKKAFAAGGVGALGQAVEDAAAPAVADLDGDGTLEIALLTFDHGLDVFTVPSSAENCVLWGTGRGSTVRSGTGPSTAR